MNIEPQTLIFLSEILGVVMRHDPVIMARVQTHYDRRVAPRPDHMRRAANDDYKG